MLAVIMLGCISLNSAASRARDCGNPTNLVALAQSRVDRAPDGTRSSLYHGFLVLKTLTFDQVATHGEERRMEKFINTELLWSTFTTANGSRFD